MKANELSLRLAALTPSAQLDRPAVERAICAHLAGRVGYGRRRRITWALSPGHCLELVAERLSRDQLADCARGCADDEPDCMSARWLVETTSDRRSSMAACVRRAPHLASHPIYPARELATVCTRVRPGAEVGPHWIHLLEAARHGLFMAADTPDELVLVPAPFALFDDDGRLHATDQPAIQWLDGEAIWFEQDCPTASPY